MPKLVVSWWGDYTDSKKIDTIYKWLLAGKRILYIPRAFYPEWYNWCFEWIQNTFPTNEGYEVHMISEQEYAKSNEDYLNKYDGMYIWWGNTYKLLKLVKDTWFSNTIQQFLKNDKPIYGGSAWAIIMGKEIHTAPDANVVRLSLEETTWFNICNDHSIFCHYNEWYDNEIKDYVKHYQTPVICLPEWTGIICDDDIYTIQWEKTAYLFDILWNKKELPIESTI
jgi:dipeptidase E